MILYESVSYNNSYSYVLQKKWYNYIISLLKHCIQQTTLHSHLAFIIVAEHQLHVSLNSPIFASNLNIFISINFHYFHRSVSKWSMAVSLKLHQNPQWVSLTHMRHIGSNLCRCLGFRNVIPLSDSAALTLDLNLWVTYIRRRHLYWHNPPEGDSRLAGPSAGKVTHVTVALVCGNAQCLAAYGWHLDDNRRGLPLPKGQAPTSSASCRAGRAPKERKRERAGHRLLCTEGVCGDLNKRRSYSIQTGRGHAAF